LGSSPGKSKTQVSGEITGMKRLGMAHVGKCFWTESGEEFKEKISLAAALETIRDFPNTPKRK